MTYSSGGLIQAADYNSFINGSNQFNTVWSTGTGNAGYGQTAISAVSAGNQVTAAQWASLINNLNNALTHQSGSGSGISATTSGSKINYLSTLSTSINTSYTNRLNVNSRGSTTTGSVFSPRFQIASSASAQSLGFTRTITFASGDAARYFFNAGGRLNFVITSVTNNNGQGRSTDIATLVGTYFGGFSNFGSTTNGGRTGTGGTLNGNLTSYGYWNMTTAAQTIVQITSTTYPYNGDFMVAYAYNSASNASGHSDNGYIVYIYLYVYLNALQSDFGNKAIDVTINHRVDIQYPETTYLTSSWGTPTVT
jgi:hypothetical protein